MANTRQQGNVAVKQVVHINEPPRYKVVMYNDDVTTMDFVVYVLRKIFRLPERKAIVTMLKIHKQGQATIGVYLYDIAMTLTERTVAAARANGFPLRVEYMPA